MRGARCAHAHRCPTSESQLSAGKAFDVCCNALGDSHEAGVTEIAEVTVAHIRHCGHGATTWQYKHFCGI